MANDLIPYKRPGEDVTGLTTAAVTGCYCVQITDNKTETSEGLFDTADGNLYRVGLPSASGAAGAAKKAFGVAKYDAASGARVGIARAGIIPIKVGAAPISAGAEVEVEAGGTIKTLASGIAVGMALNDALAASLCEVWFYS